VPSVRLVAGRLQVDGSAEDPALIRKALADWYTRAGQRWTRGRLQPWAARMDVPEPKIRVRDLGHRWGNFRAGPGNGLISLHWATFQLPIRLVDYVIAHELAHVKVSGHGSDYWRLLGRALPECRQIKTELDELGRRVWMGDLSS
jgi:predicted metal-dependent hydrolase